jgi:hypothetical protein
LILVDLTKTEPRLSRRYLGKAETAAFLAFQKQEQLDAAGKALRVVSWAVRGITALILLRISFKFTAAPESFISSRWEWSLGKVGSIVELVASLLLLVPRTAMAGALLSPA